jgi:hypothetical protein
MSKLNQYKKLNILEKDKVFLDFIKDGILSVNIETGIVVNNKTGKELGFLSKKKTQITNIMFSHEGYLYSITRARLVWLAANGPIAENLFVARKDTPLFDGISNLKLDTTSNIVTNAIKNDPTVRLTSSKLTEKEVQEIRFLRELGWTYDSIAYRYKVNKITILALIKGKTWKHIKGDNLIDKTELSRLVNPAKARKFMSFRQKSITKKSTKEKKPPATVTIKNFVALQEEKYPKTCQSIKRVFEKNCNYKPNTLYAKIMELKPSMPEKSVKIVIKHYQNYYLNLVRN